MTERYEEVLKALQACEVDTREEERMLTVNSGARHTVVLVAGTQAARPFDLATPLLKGEEHFGNQAVPYPVQFGFGERFRIWVEDKNGKEHIYMRWEDLWADLGTRPCDMVRCYVDTDISALDRVEFRFLLLDEDNVRQLSELAADCRAFLIVLPSGAGAPGEEVYTLCRWIRDVRCLPQRTGILLNHTEMGLVVSGLPRTVQAWLGAGDTKQWKCSYQDAGGPGSQLEDVMAWVLAGDGDHGYVAQADGQMVTGCVRRALEKLDAAREDLDREMTALETAAQRVCKAQEGFRAYAENKGATMRFQMNEIQMAELEKDIDGLIQLLQDKLPEMLQEVLDNSPDGKQAKQDMKLVDDYLESVCGGYIAALTSRIANSWQDTVKDTFHSALVEFRAIVTDTPSALKELDTQSDAEILNSIQVNLGGYVDPTASTIGTIAGKSMSLLFTLLMLADETGLGTAVYYATRPWLEKTVGRAVQSVVDTLMPADVYARHLLKVLQNYVFDPKPQKEEDFFVPLAQKLKDNLKVNTLPVAERTAKQQYQGMVDLACGVLGQEAVDTLAQRDRLADKKRRLLQQAETFQTILAENV